MRKTALFLALMCLPTAVQADPPARDAAKHLGYSEEIQKNLPGSHFPRAPQEKLPSRGSAPGVTNTNWSESLPPRLYQAPEPSTMIPTLMRLHQSQPGSAKITRKLALTFMQAHQPQDALHWFTQTYMRDRKDLSALWNMGALSMQLKDFSGARAFFEEYARLDKTSPWGRMAARYLRDGFATYSESSNSFPGMARTGYVQMGSSGASSSIMIIDGQVAEPPAATRIFVPFAPSEDEKPGNQAETRESPKAKRIPPASTVPLAHARIDTAIPPAPPAQTASPAQAVPAPAAPVPAPATGTPTP